MSLKKNISVFCGIPNLANDDRYKSYLLRVLTAVHNQETPIKILKPYVTPPHAGVFEHGKTNRLDAIIGRMNNIIDKYMTTDASHLWILDGDVEPPPHALGTLIRHNVDMASGVYPSHNFVESRTLIFGKMEKGHPCGFSKPHTWEYMEGKVFGETEAWSGGSGCLLMKRRLLKQHHPRLPALRFSRIGEDRRECGGDRLFWKRVQDAGFTARVDANVLCGHLPNYRLTEIDEWLYGIEDEE